MFAGEADNRVKASHASRRSRRVGPRATLLVYMSQNLLPYTLELYSAFTRMPTRTLTDSAHLLIAPELTNMSPTITRPLILYSFMNRRYSAIGAGTRLANKEGKRRSQLMMCCRSLLAFLPGFASRSMRASQAPHLRGLATCLKAKSGAEEEERGPGPHPWATQRGI